MIEINGEKAYTTTEVAAILKVQQQAVRKNIDRGKLKAIRPDRQYYILESDLRNYLEYRKLYKEE